MAQVGGNDVFCLKIVEIHVAMKKKRCGTLTNIKMLTDQRYEPDNTGSGVKMASKWLKNGKNRWKWHSNDKKLSCSFLLISFNDFPGSS